MNTVEIVDREKKRRLERGYEFEAEFTFTVRGKEYTQSRRWSIPLDTESRIDMLGLMERAKNGESIIYTFRSGLDVKFEPNEFLDLANKALQTYSKIHHLAKEAVSLKDEEFRNKFKELESV